MQPCVSVLFVVALAFGHLTQFLWLVVAISQTLMMMMKTVWGMWGWRRDKGYH